MSCFETAHYEQCIRLFVEVERNGQKYTRSVHKHPIVTQLNKFYDNLYGIREKENVIARRGRPRLTEENASTIGRNPTSNPPMDRISVNTDENVSLLGSKGSTLTFQVQTKSQAKGQRRQLLQRRSSAIRIQTRNQAKGQQR